MGCNTDDLGSAGARLGQEINRRDAKSRKTAEPVDISGRKNAAFGSLDP
jgi:hypothetical protein